MLHVFMLFTFLKVEQSTPVMDELFVICCSVLCKHWTLLSACDGGGQPQHIAHRCVNVWASGKQRETVDTSSELYLFTSLFSCFLQLNEILQ